jgi:drug/metabolite transporter (DMT)-like permease
MSPIEPHADPKPAIQSSPVAAAIWMAASFVCFAAMAVAARVVLTRIDTFELMAYRSGIGLVVICGLLLFSRPGFVQIRTTRLGLHTARNLVHFAAQNLWYFGVMVLPLAQLVTLEFTAPLWVALIAPLLLGEALTRTRLLAILLGFLGILIVSRPGVAPLEAGHLAVLGAAMGFATNTIVTRKLSRIDTTLCVLFWMTLTQFVLGILFALPGGFNSFPVHMLPWILVIGISGLLAHYCLTSSLYCAPATVVAPMEFGRLPVMAAVGILLYGEPLEIAVIVGAAVILLGNLINLRAERRLPAGAE